MASATASPNAASARPRIYPAGRAVLLLGACGADLAGRKITVDGRRVQTVRYGSLALAVSFVDPDAYDPAEIARKREEASWLGSEARALERAVDRLASTGDVLPMKLLTVFAHADALEAAAVEHHGRWSRALSRLATKRECVVHVYAGPHVPPGAGPYVARVSQTATRATRKPTFPGDDATVAVLDAFWRDCTRLAIATRRVACVPERGARFAQALLVSESEIASVDALVARFNAAAGPLGLIAYLEGPRRPFSFVAS